MGVGYPWDIIEAVIRGSDIFDCVIPTRNARNGKVLYFIPEHVSTIRPSGMGGVGAMGEGVTADKDGNIYAGDVGVFKGMTRFVPRLIP